jgi:hypothetical protein
MYLQNIVRFLQVVTVQVIVSIVTLKPTESMEYSNERHEDDVLLMNEK